MKRPCYALSILLTSLACTLLAVGTVRSQTRDRGGLEDSQRGFEGSKIRYGCRDQYGYEYGCGYGYGYDFGYGWQDDVDYQRPPVKSQEAEGDDECLYTQHSSSRGLDIDLTEEAISSDDAASEDEAASTDEITAAETFSGSDCYDDYRCGEAPTYQCREDYGCRYIGSSGGYRYRSGHDADYDTQVYGPAEPDLDSSDYWTAAAADATDAAEQTDYPTSGELIDYEAWYKGLRLFEAADDEVAGAADHGANDACDDACEVAADDSSADYWIANTPVAGQSDDYCSDYCWDDCRGYDDYGSYGDYEWYGSDDAEVQVAADESVAAPAAQMAAISQIERHVALMLAGALGDASAAMQQMSQSLIQWAGGDASGSEVAGRVGEMQETIGR